MIKRFFVRIISIGITSDLTRDEIKRVKLTNGCALIISLINIVKVLVDMSVEFITDKRLSDSYISGIFGLLVSLLMIFSIFLNYRRAYFYAKLILLLVCWIVLIGFSMVYGKASRIDHYMFAVLLAPAVLFSKKRQVYLGIAITAVLLVGVNIYYDFISPLIVISGSYARYPYLIGIVITIISIVAVSLYVRWQNDSTEAMITNEAMALKESEQTFRALFEESSDAILLLNREGDFVECNQAALDLLKMTRKEFMSMSLEKISPEFQPNGRKSEEVLFEDRERALKKGSHRYDWTCVNSIGEEFIIEVSLVAIRVKGQTMLHSTWRDITQRKKYENELKEANIAKDKFFSIIAHDLKGPIGNIANLLKYIGIEGIKPEYFSQLQSSAQNTYELIQDLLTWARAQKDQIEIEPKSFNIHEYLKDIIAPLQFSADQKNILLKIAEGEKKLFVFADIPSIKTVIRNFVSNAIKFTKEGGRITLSASLEEDKVKIKVSDTGVGISLDKISQLFKIGSRITSPGTMNEKGTGLGLLLCKEFVELNKGEIGVESEINIGSTFWFTLPVGKPIDLEKILKSVIEQNFNILIVEDNFLNLQNTLTEIKKANIHYETVKDGKEAIKMGTSREFDFILMDIDLPKKNGIEANKAIRKKYPNIKIIALSSYIKAEILQRDEKVQFEEYLKKPLILDNLLYVLDKLF